LSGIFVADGKSEKSKKQKKTSVKHIRIRLIVGYVNKEYIYLLEAFKISFLSWIEAASRQDVKCRRCKCISQLAFRTLQHWPVLAPLISVV